MKMTDDELRNIIKEKLEDKCGYTYGDIEILDTDLFYNEMAGYFLEIMKELKEPESA